MELLLTACFLSLACTWAVPAMAQYIGPDSGPDTVNDLRWMFDDEGMVGFTGRIVCRVDDDLYEFTDGTGTVCIEINQRDLPWLRIGDPLKETAVNVYGRYVHKLFWRSRIEVVELRPVGGEKHV